MVILLLLTPACSAGVLVRFEQPVMQPREAAELPDRAVERKQQERRDRRALAQMRPMRPMRPMRQGSSIPLSNCFDRPVMYITRYRVMQGTRGKKVHVEAQWRHRSRRFRHRTGRERHGEVGIY